jgi:hypothetical protein
MSAKRLFPFLLFFCLPLVLGSCGRDTPETPSSPSSIEGRWQRLSESGPGGPHEVAGDYLEFREDGELLVLMNDNGRFWLLLTAAYTVTAPGQLDVSGTCWRSWDNFPCDGRYTVNLTGDQLTLTGEREARYLYVGAAGPERPSELFPPVASPTP